MSSFTGKGDGGLVLLTWPCLGGAASASAALAPGLPPEMPPRAQSRTRAGGGAARAPRGCQVTCEEAWLEAAPGCRVRSASRFLAVPHTRLPWGHVFPAVCPSVLCWPTMDSGPLLASLVPVQPDCPPTASLKGLQGLGGDPSRGLARRALSPPPLPLCLPPPLLCSYLKQVVAVGNFFRCVVSSSSAQRPGVCALGLVTHPRVRKAFLLFDACLRLCGLRTWPDDGCSPRWNSWKALEVPKWPFCAVTRPRSPRAEMFCWGQGAAWLGGCPS